MKAVEEEKVQLLSINHGVHVHRRKLYNNVACYVMAPTNSVRTCADRFPLVFPFARGALPSPPKHILP